MKLFKDVLVDFIRQTWTLLGMFIAWVLLEGSARTVVGFSILFSLTIWLLTFRLREPSETDDEVDSE